MAKRSPQTMAKRERELAKREKRERKREKKAAAAEAKAAQAAAPTDESADLVGDTENESVETGTVTAPAHDQSSDAPAGESNGG